MLEILATIAYITFKTWPEKKKGRCKVCGYLSEQEVCSQVCQARIDLQPGIYVKPQEFTTWNKDKFGF